MDSKETNRYDSHRMSNSIKKVYEEMLLKDIPGSNKPNQPMHAVLESSLGDDGGDGTTSNEVIEAQKVRNHALIHYLASLATSNNNEDKFDFDFVDSLIKNGADINSTDKTGQTIFHEVARSWNLDVASFLIDHGADVNKRDKFGRSPLHVCAAVDYAAMAQFLINNGADINITTHGEGQMPIHYAAKNDACNSLKMLLGYGADIDSRDSKNKSPLQLAAQMNRDKSARLLIQQGAPAGVNDHSGNSALVLLIEKLPEVAVEALGQFQSVNTINRKEYFFLNYLEGDRLRDPKSPAYSALEIAVQNQEFDVILHPVMQRLIFIKWQRFGRFGALKDLMLNLLYAILWTVLAVGTPAPGIPMYLPWAENVWRLVIAALVCIMTVDEIRKQLTGILKTRKRQRKWLTWRAADLKEELAYCHPRWPQEQMYLNSEIAAIEDTALMSSGDSWIYFDWFSLVMILATIASHMTYVNMHSMLTHTIYIRIITVLLLVLWFRILKYARPFESAGPFVVIFGHIGVDILTWATLLLVIAIPFGCAFWITFGRHSKHPVESYSYISPLLYNMFSMLVVNDHDFESLHAVNATMARILCGTFIGIMAIINLNLLIALLSETFSRVYSNAIANAIMQRAKTILLIEKSLSSKQRKAYQEYIKSNCSPETVDLQRDGSMSSGQDNQIVSAMLQQHVEEIHALLNERLGKFYGKGQKSDFDLIRENIVALQKSREEEKDNMKLLETNVNQTRELLMRVSKRLDVDIDSISSPETENQGTAITRPPINTPGRRNFDTAARNTSNDVTYAEHEVSLHSSPLEEYIVHENSAYSYRDDIDEIAGSRKSGSQASISYPEEIPRAVRKDSIRLARARSDGARCQMEPYIDGRLRSRSLGVGSGSGVPEKLPRRATISEGYRPRDIDAHVRAESSGSDDLSYESGPESNRRARPRSGRERLDRSSVGPTDMLGRPRMDPRFRSLREIPPIGHGDMNTRSSPSIQERRSRKGRDSRQDSHEESSGTDHGPRQAHYSRRGRKQPRHTWHDNLGYGHSDTDILERKPRRGSQYYDDWDDKSVKSVAF